MLRYTISSRLPPVAQRSLLHGPLWAVSDALRDFPTSPLLDREVIAINNKGQPDFEALQARLGVVPV